MNFAFVFTSAFIDLVFPLHSSMPSVVDLLPAPGWHKCGLPPRSRRGTKSNSQKGMHPAVAVESVSDALRFKNNSPEAPTCPKTRDHVPDVTGFLTMTTTATAFYSDHLDKVKLPDGISGWGATSSVSLSRSHCPWVTSTGNASTGDRGGFPQVRFLWARPIPK